MAGEYKTPKKLNDLFKEYDASKKQGAEVEKTRWQVHFHRRGEEKDAQALGRDRVVKEITPVLEAFAASLNDAGHDATVDVDLPQDYWAAATLRVRPSKGLGHESRITFRCTQKGEVMVRADGLPDARSLNRKVEDVKADWVEGLLLQHVATVLRVMGNPQRRGSHGIQGQEVSLVWEGEVREEGGCCGEAPLQT